MKTRKLFLPLLLIALLAACGKAPAETTVPTQPPVETTVPADTEPAHEHTPTVYEYDSWEHWYVCDCGKTVYEVHWQDAEGRCRICGITLQFYASGYYDILIYDDHGTLTSETNYDNEGNVIGWETMEVEYFSDGNLKHTYTRTPNGRNYEVFYTHRENGEGVRCDYRIYHEPDGWYSVHNWDEREDLIQINTYNPQDELVSVEDRIYEYAPDGSSVHLTCIVDGVISETRDYLITADGTQLITYSAQYWDGKIESVSTWEYDEEGNIISQDIIFYDEDGNPIQRP